jgi:CRP-like cAMP-binding protein
MKKYEIRDLLPESPFFEGMLHEHIDFISGCAKLAHFKEGEFLAQAGDDAQTFCLIRIGSAAIEINAGNRIHLIQTILPGNVIGWTWLVEPYVWQYDVRAIEDISAFEFDARCVLEKIDDDPVFGLAMYKRMTPLIVERLLAHRAQLSDFYA